MTDGPLVRELSPPPDPAACCERLAGWSHRVWLDSGSDATRLGRYSFLSADPCLVIEARGGRAFRTRLPGGTREASEADALSALRQAIAPFRRDSVPDLPPFQGGLVGYIGYEFGGTLETLPPPRAGGLGIPDLAFGLYDWTLAWDHQEGRAWLISTGLPEQGPARVARAEARMTDVLQRLMGRGPLSSIATHARERRPASPTDAGVSREPALSSSLSHAEYLAAVRRVQEYILAGDVYQANITQRFRMPIDEDPWTLYTRLRAGNPAPFSAYLDFPGLAVASVSPERFLRLTSRGVAEARPIKGTRPRGATPAEDEALARELLGSEKDRAEHVMIVDLMRNDLSRVCATGSVRVPELFALERYATVHHLVSTVVGELRPECDAIDLLRATFPGGSITGAPKIRAMEIIAELEPVRRDLYCGTIAYLSVTGALDASIVIRTALIRDGQAYCSAGGGIVADSDPEAEYVESWNKVRGLLDVIGPALPAGGSL